MIGLLLTISSLLFTLWCNSQGNVEFNQKQVLDNSMDVLEWQVGTVIVTTRLSPETRNKDLPKSPEVLRVVGENSNQDL